MTSPVRSARVTRSISILSSPPSAQPPRLTQNDSSPPPSSLVLNKRLHASASSPARSKIQKLADGIEQGFITAIEILRDEERTKLSRLDGDASAMTGGTTFTPTNGKLIAAKKSMKTKSVAQIKTKNAKITGKITKPSSATANKKTSVTKTTLDIYEIPLTQSSPPPVAVDKPDESSTFVGASPPREYTITSCKRQRTPVKDTASPDIIDLSEDTPEQNRPVFSDLMKGFSYDGCDNETAGAVNGAEKEPMTKRQCLGFVNLPSAASNINASRGKLMALAETKVTSKPIKALKPKKKLLTITGLATAAYLPAIPETLNSSIVESLTPGPEAPPDHFTKNGTVRRRAARPTTKTPRSKEKAKMEPSPEPILLSPTSARRAIKDQSFVFGTSSQIMLGKMPEGGWPSKIVGGVLKRTTTEDLFLEDVIVDVDEMFEMTDDDDEMMDNAKNNSADTSITLYGKSVESIPLDDNDWGISNLEIYKTLAKSSRTKTGKMWDICARGPDGNLLKPELLDMVDNDIGQEVVDMADEEEFDMDRIEARIQMVEEQNTNETIENDYCSLMDIPKILMTPETVEFHSLPVKDIGLELLGSQIMPIPPPSHNNLERNNALATTTKAATSAPSIITSVLPTIAQGTSTTTVTVQATKGTSLAKSKSKQKDKGLSDYTNADRPDFDTYTMIQLQAQIAKYGFKSIQTRKAMITLLNKCWDSILKRAAEARGKEMLQVVTNEETVATPKRAPPKQKKVADEEAEPVMEDIAKPKSPKKAPVKRTQKLLQNITNHETTSTQITAPVKKPARTTPSAMITEIIHDDNASTSMPTSGSSLFSSITLAITTQLPSTNLLNPTFHQRILMYEPIVVEELTEWLISEDGGNLKKANMWGEKASLVEDGELTARKCKNVQDWCEKRSVVCMRRESLGGGNRKRH